MPNFFTGMQTAAVNAIFAAASPRRTMSARKRVRRRAATARARVARRKTRARSSPRRARLVKGSAAAKRYMAKIRRMRKR